MKSRIVVSDDGVRNVARFARNLAATTFVIGLIVGIVIGLSF